MAISYSGIVGYGKASLPSVDSWGTNNNILRDPPKSITTRRRDKVGSNSAIIEDIDASGDRVAESIRAYPRGVNPMVAVSYNGQGNAGIGKSQALLTRGQQAKLPYRVMMGGAFRAPVLAPVDLLPLSRMPRNLTKINPTICNPDFTKKASCTADKKTFRPETLKATMATKVLFNIKKPSVVGVQGQTKDNVLVAKDVRSNVKFEKGLQRNINGGAQARIRDTQSAPTDIKAGATRNIFVKRNINDAGTSKGAIHDTILAGEIICPAGSSGIIKTRELYGEKILTRVPCTATDVGTGKSFKMFKSGSGAGHQQRSAFITRKGVLAEAQTSQKGPIKFACAPESLAGNRTREAFNASIVPTAPVARGAAIVDRPEYRRAFGMGGIIVPDGGTYNTAKY